MDFKQSENRSPLKLEIQKLCADYQKYLLTMADDNQHKAALLFYWLQSYKGFLLRETEFDPRKIRRYSRGDLLKVDFGFNVGSEQGGLHYAVVIENNAISSKVVTVIPMKSKKPWAKSHVGEIDIKDELLLRLKDKIDKLICEGKENIRQGATTDDKQALQSLIKKLDAEILAVEECLEQLKSMKDSSIVLVKQITTISKMRIVDPLYDNDVLAKVRLSSQTLDRIDNEILKQFTNIGN